MSTSRVYVALCPNCGSDVRMADGVDLESMVTCQNCATDLALVSLSPPELDFYWEDAWEDGEDESESLEDDDAFGADGLEDDWDDDAGYEADDD